MATHARSPNHLVALLGAITPRLWETVRDLLPIVAVISFFQLAVLKTPFPDLADLLVGAVMVILGLMLFVQGLQMGLFPIGEAMAIALARKGSVTWLLVFSFALGFSTTIAEPALIAVAIKANQVSGGTVSVNGLRFAVAIGVAVGVTLGAFRIVTGTPLHWYIITGYVLVIIQTTFAPKTIIPLAFDSGGVTTSTVTVPLVAALGLGLSATIPGRSPLLDGFGLIAFASLFPIIAVMAYAQLSARSAHKYNGYTRTQENNDH